jgi:hypothetical protein
MLRVANCVLSVARAGGAHCLLRVQVVCRVLHSKCCAVRFPDELCSVGHILREWCVCADVILRAS